MDIYGRVTAVSYTHLDVYKRQECNTNNSNVLKDYLIQKRYKSLVDQYWIKVSSAFQKDFEMSYNRGGPVGKSLQNNAKIINETIINCIPKDSKGNPIESELNYICLLYTSRCV